mmetsp:Transcript_8618/g.19367  ORF Transcript_8618/g.19367 Transcript_8618/m.19367 type:complete len:545 (+) Transcript_8618:310-1944(+)
MAFRIALFYKYTPISDPAAFVSTQHALCSKLGLTGRLLVGAEGVNGTLSCEVSSSALQDWIDRTGSLPGFQDVDWKLSEGDVAPFANTLTVKVVNEIVATGNAAVGDIAEHGGRHLSPHDFHSALANADGDTVVIDVRNTFEHAIGRFETGAGLSAIEPKMQAFTEFDAWCEKVAPSLKDKKVLMYCTGGIRCEKASCMLTRRGVGDVSQLRGGIHRYMDAFPDGDGSLWRGKNFVFDNRVSMSIETPPVQQQQQQPPLPGVDAGSDAGEDRAVVGRCVECRAKYDVLSGNRICALCRDLVLVCPRCATLLREYHCVAHQALKTAFFSFLDDFTVEQLEEQRTKLAEVVPPRGRHCGVGGGVGSSSSSNGCGGGRGGGPGGDGPGIGGTNKRFRPETQVNSGDKDGGEMAENDAAGREGGETSSEKLQFEKVEPVNAPLKIAAGSTTPSASGAQEAASGSADVGVAGGGLTFPAAARRDVVRACRKQLAKVDAALKRAKLEAGGAGAASNLGAWRTRCRSCGLQETVCSKSRVGTLTRCAAKRL